MNREIMYLVATNMWRIGGWCVERSNHPGRTHVCSWHFSSGLNTYFVILDPFASRIIPELPNVKLYLNSHYLFVG